MAVIWTRPQPKPTDWVLVQTEHCLTTPCVTNSGRPRGKAKGFSVKKTIMQNHYHIHPQAGLMTDNRRILQILLASRAQKT